MGGMVSVGQDGGGVFTAVLPGCLDAEVPDGELAEVPEGELSVPRPRVVS
jgi:hypothetical protein